MVPLMKVVEYFDLDYQFSSTIGTFTIEQQGKSMIFLLGSNEVYVGDRIVHLKEKVTLDGEQIIIPADGVDLIMNQLYGKDKEKAMSWSFNGSVFTEAEKVAARKAYGRPRENTVPDSKRRRRSPGRKSDYEIKTIVIDPGHGGKDPGGIGYHSIMEKDVVLEVSKELEKELHRRFSNKEIIMTREDDHFLSLEERGEIANVVDPDRNPIFISIHANVSFVPDTYGYESYFLSIDPFGEKARDVASKENSVLYFEIDNYNEYLKEIINRIVDIEYRRESMLLAEHIQKKLGAAVSAESVDRGVKSAFFYVLKSAKMPAVLVEIGFVTNRDEALRMLKQEYQKRLIRGIADGIEDFVTDFRQTKGFTQ